MGIPAPRTEPIAAVPWASESGYEGVAPLDVPREILEQINTRLQAFTADLPERADREYAQWFERLFGTTGESLWPRQLPRCRGN